MKNLIYVFILLFFIIGCSSTNKSISKTNEGSTKASDTIRIANDSLEYEVIIIDGGFTYWLNSQARQKDSLVTYRDL